MKRLWRAVGRRDRDDPASQPGLARLRVALETHRRSEMERQKGSVDASGGVVVEAYAVAEVAYQAGLTPDALATARDTLRGLRDRAESRQDRRAIQGILDDLASAETYAEHLSRDA
jgi:hypothetical protein